MGWFKRIKKKFRKATRTLTLGRAKKVVRKETKGITKTFKPVKKRVKEKTKFITEAGRIAIGATETTGGFVTETPAGLEKGFSGVMHSDEFRMVASIYVNAIIGSALGAAGKELVSGATTWAKNIPEVKAMLESDVVLSAMEAKDQLKEIEEYINKYEEISDDPLKFFASEIELPSYAVDDMNEYKDELRVAKNAYKATNDINTAINDPTKFTTNLLKEKWRNRDDTDSTQFDLGLDFDINLPKFDYDLPKIDLPKLDVDFDIDFPDLDFDLDLPKFDWETTADMEEVDVEEPIDTEVPSDTEEGEGFDFDIDRPKRRRGKLRRLFQAN